MNVVSRARRTLRAHVYSARAINVRAQHTSGSRDCCVNVVTAVYKSLKCLFYVLPFPPVFLTSCNTVFVLFRYTPILALHATVYPLQMHKLLY